MKVLIEKKENEYHLFFNSKHFKNSSLEALVKMIPKIDDPVIELKFNGISTILTRNTNV